MSAKSSKSGHHPDYFLVALILVITVVGLVILTSASSDLGKKKFNDSYYYLKHQILNGLILGLAGFVAASRLNYQIYKKTAFILLLISLGLLTFVFTRFGITAGGASRWVRFGPVSFQPAEILKLTFIMYLAAWLANPKMNRARNFLTGLLPFLTVSGGLAVLLLLQPATSTVVILITSGTIVYFISGAKWRYLAAAISGGALIFGLVVYLTPYRLERIKGFLNINHDAQGTNYQLNQALIAIGSGRTFGVGYGQSTAKVNYLPAPIDDSIFAVAAEELGFVGAAGLIIFFAALVFRMIWIARAVRDKFGQMMIVGFAAIIALQSFIHIAANSGLIPLTGVPLPFVSYGGTALAVFLMMGGITVNVSRYT